MAGSSNTIAVAGNKFSYSDYKFYIVDILLKEHGFANIPYLARRLSVIFKNNTYETLRTTIHRVAKQLAREGIVEVEKSGGLTWLILRRLPNWFVEHRQKEVDLISITGGGNRQKPRKRRRINVVPWRLAPEKQVLRDLFWKRPLTDEKERQFWVSWARDMFSDYVNRISSLRIVLRDDISGELRVIKLATRYTSPSLNIEQLEKFKRIYYYYAKKYKVGVFLTITFPPVLPLGLYPRVASYVLKQLMAWLRKNNHGQEIRILRINEFQENGALHLHVIIFGVARIADKRELTIRLDMWFVNALLRLYKFLPERLVNLMIARYIRYCRHNKKYEGPVNWVTKIDFRTGEWNPPPDYVKWLREREERKKGENQTFRDGGPPDPGDYLSKYIGKFIGIAARVARGELEPDKLDLKYLMYWLLSIPFFYCDTKIYKKLGLSKQKTGSNYKLVGVYHLASLPDFLWDKIELQEVGLVV